MEPEMLAAERLRSCKYVREEMEEEKVVRLRKVLGREREMTLFCGEQVTPFHWHGVGWEGSQVESGEEAGEGMSDALRRDSRASPSEDKE